MWAHTLNFKANFKFLQLIFGETPVPVGVFARQPWSTSNACKNLRAHHPLTAEILCPEKCPLGWINMHLHNVFVCGPKFTDFISLNVGGVVVQQLRFRFSIRLPVAEILSSEIAPNCGPLLFSQILGADLSKNCTHVITPTSRHVTWKSFVRIFPLAPNL